MIRRAELTFLTSVGSVAVAVAVTVAGAAAKKKHKQTQTKQKKLQQKATKHYILNTTSQCSAAWTSSAMGMPLADPFEWRGMVCTS